MNEKKGEALTNDVLDNIPLAGWMIRRHLDAVSSFYFDVDKAAGDNRKVVMDLFCGSTGRLEILTRQNATTGDESMRLFEMGRF